MVEFVHWGLSRDTPYLLSHPHPLSLIILTICRHSHEMNSLVGEDAGFDPEYNCMHFVSVFWCLL